MVFVESQKVLNAGWYFGQPSCNGFASCVHGFRFGVLQFPGSQSSWHNNANWKLNFLVASCPPTLIPFKRCNSVQPLRCSTSRLPRRSFIIRILIRAGSGFAPITAASSFADQLIRFLKSKWLRKLSVASLE